jgi:hypothetical protein
MSYRILIKIRRVKYIENAKVAIRICKLKKDGLQKKENKI